MMDLIDLASTLFSNRRTEVSNAVDSGVEMLSATAAVDSDSGNVGVYLDADITTADDTEGDESYIDMPTSPSVLDGDDLLIGLVGSGTMRTPVVLANYGSGDRMQEQIDTAGELAERAEQVANATSQHFWEGDDGAHVTQATQEDWNDPLSPDYHSGPNALWNSLGMLFRDGLTNLLAILTNGIAVYDGNGNAASNIIAKFVGTGAQIGRDSDMHVTIDSDSLDVIDGATKLITMMKSAYAGFIGQTIDFGTYETHGSGMVVSADTSASNMILEVNTASKFCDINIDNTNGVSDLNINGMDYISIDGTSFASSDVVQHLTCVPIAHGGTGQTTADAAARALGMAKTKGDSWSMPNVTTMGFVNNARMTVNMFVPLPYRIYGSPTVNVTGTVRFRQYNGTFLLGSSNATAVDLAPLVQGKSINANGYILLNLGNGSTISNATANAAVVVQFATFNITLS